MSRSAPRALVTLFLVAAAGCGGEDARPAAWSYISPVLFEPNCATTSCHSPAAAVAGLDFSTPDHGYKSLFKLWVGIVDPSGTASGECIATNGTTVCEQGFRPLVTPYDPDGSRLVNMLRARGAPRMPPDRPLPEADIRLVERWILAGATWEGLAPRGQDAGSDDGAGGSTGGGDPFGATLDAGANADGVGGAGGAGGGNGALHGVAGAGGASGGGGGA